MLKKIFIYVPLFCFAIIAQAQTKHRYKDIMYQDVTVEKDQTYNPAAFKDDKKAYLFDLYSPTGDDAKHRPLIIWMHGGGFKFGSKSAEDVALWSKTFAQRGYVCANINYRLSKKNPLFHFDELMKGSYYAVQDVKIAVEYFKRNAVRYGIDPDKIVLAGNSAGGIIALQAAYATNAELADMTKITGDSIAINRPHERVHVAAVINFWGGIYNLDWLKNAKVPIVTCLGSNDGMVSPTHKTAPLYGGEDIHAKADALGIPNELKVFEGYSHELEKRFNPFFSGGKGTKERWLEAGQFSADFLYKNVIE
ncbi:alpha/beta hydrolase [Mucilaginibacter sp.]